MATLTATKMRKSRNVNVRIDQAAHSTICRMIGMRMVEDGTQHTVSSWVQEAIREKLVRDAISFREED